MFRLPYCPTPKRRRATRSLIVTRHKMVTRACTSEQGFSRECLPASLLGRRECRQGERRAAAVASRVVGVAVKCLRRGRGTPPLFFCATLQLLIVPPHRATAGRPTLGARSVFFACEGESHLSPAPTPHTGEASSGQTVRAHSILGPPPVTWAFHLAGVPKVSPRFN